MQQQSFIPCACVYDLSVVVGAGSVVCMPKGRECAKNLFCFMFEQITCNISCVLCFRTLRSRQHLQTFRLILPISQSTRTIQRSNESWRNSLPSWVVREPKHPEWEDFPDKWPAQTVAVSLPLCCPLSLVCMYVQPIKKFSAS